MHRKSQRQPKCNDVETIVTKYLPTDDVCVIYIGANTGQELTFFYQHFNSATIYCFEALKNTISFLQITASNLKLKYPGKDIETEIHNRAVCNRDGQIVLYYNPDDPAHQSATIMPFLPHELEKKGARAARRRSKRPEVEILTDAIKLDTFIKEKKINKIDLLYADVEGAQKALLLGATESLEKTDYLLLETQELWGGPTKTQLTNMLSDHFVVEVELGADTLFKNINLPKEDK
tara:strand:+ start:1246 stop:1947 length:702 start_codon:yes stop_codon:yes gene_type:complete